MILSPAKQKIFDSDPVKKAFLNREPYAFYGWGLNYPKQFEVIRNWVRDQPTITVLTGWKRTGKTQVPVFIMSCWFLSELNRNWPGAQAMGIKQSLRWPPSTTLSHRTAWIGAKSSDHAENVLIPMYKSLIPGHMIKQDMTKNDKRIIGHDDSRFIVRTYEQDLETWKSGTAEMIHLDEEPPLGVMNECLNRIITTKGKIFISVAIDDADISWLPDACDNPKKFFGTDSFLHVKMGVEDVPDDIYPAEKKQETYNKYDGTQYELAVRKGDWARISGLWYKEFGEHNIIEPFQIPDHWLKWRFIDSGYSAPTACLWVAMHPKGDIFIYREFYRAGLTIQERVKEIIEISGNKRQREHDYWIEVQNHERYVGTYIDYHVFKVDETTGDGADQVWIKEGLIIQPSTTLRQEPRRELTNRFLAKDMTRNHFITNEKGAPKLYVMSNCTNLLWEMQKKTVKREKSDKHAVSERKVDNRDDHLCDCNDYACAELDNWVGLQEKDIY